MIRDNSAIAAGLGNGRSRSDTVIAVTLGIWREFLNAQESTTGTRAAESRRGRNNRRVEGDLALHGAYEAIESRKCQPCPAKCDAVR